VRPFDLLNNAVNKSVIVGLKGGKEFRGIMTAFDVHMNIVLERAELLDENGQAKKGYGRILIRGDSVTHISPSE